MMKTEGATHTAKEIFQQPEVWKASLGLFNEQKETYQNFIKQIAKKHDIVQVIFTGAGTSAYIGNTLVPVLKDQDNNNVFFESAPTTDIVSNPSQYLVENIPTILVSFARSGNSPESVAAVNLGKKRIKDFYQVVITCNREGQLAENVIDDENSITILLPEEANDKSLAMTSSFTCMLLMGYALFQKDDSFDGEMEKVIASGEELMRKVEKEVDEVLQTDFSRIIYLGSGLLGEIGQEASLKMLELSAGRVVANFESSLGFRHGPKSVVNDESMVVVFVSQDAYTRKYDLDILREVSEGTNARKVIAVMDKEDHEVAKYTNNQIAVHSGEALNNDLYLGLLYTVFGQTLAMKKSIELGISPDNPSPDGVISRVVQGVTIYDYE